MADANEIEETATVPVTDEDRKIMTAQVERLRRRNSELINGARQLGATPDFHARMLDTYFGSLVALGKITDDEFLTIQYLWEQRFHRDLEVQFARVREIREEQARQQAAMQGGIVAPGPKKLIVPGK